MESLPPVSTTPVAICHRSQFAADVIYTGGKFATVVVDTRSKFVASVVDTSGAPLLANPRIIKYGMLC